MTAPAAPALAERSLRSPGRKRALRLPPYLVGGRVARQVAILVAAIAALSFAGPLTKLSGMDPVAALTWRCGLGVPFLLLLAPGDPPRRTIEARSLPSLLLGSLGFFGFVGLWSASFSYIAIGPSTMIVSTSAVFTFLGDWALTRCRFDWRKAVGVAIALAAVVPCVSASSSAAGTDASKGVLLSMGGAVCGSVFVLAVAHGRGEQGAASTWGAISVITALMAGLWSCWHGVLLIGLSPMVLLMLLGLAVVPHCIGQGLVVVLAKEASPLLGVLAVVGETLGASVLAMVLFHEGMTLGLIVSVAGFGLGLAMIVRASSHPIPTQASCGDAGADRES